MSLNSIMLMSDDELRDELVSYGFQPGPINDFTKNVYVKKLARLMAIDDVDSLTPTTPPPPATAASQSMDYGHYTSSRPQHTTSVYDSYGASGSTPTFSSRGNIDEVISSGRYGYDALGPTYDHMPPSADGLTRRPLHANDAEPRQQPRANQANESRSWLKYIVVILVALIVLYVIFGSGKSTGPIPQIK